jgi:hypothetical protein
LKPKILLNNIYKLSFYLAANTASPFKKKQPVNVRETNGTHTEKRMEN